MAMAVKTAVTIRYRAKDCWERYQTKGIVAKVPKVPENLGTEPMPPKETVKNSRRLLMVSPFSSFFKE